MDYDKLDLEITNIFNKVGRNQFTCNPVKLRPHSVAGNLIGNELKAYRKHKVNKNNNFIQNNALSITLYIIYGALLNFIITTLFHEYVYMNNLSTSTLQPVEELWHIKKSLSKLSQDLTTVDLKRKNILNTLENVTKQIPMLKYFGNVVKNNSKSVKEAVGSNLYVDIRGYDSDRIDFALESSGGRIVSIGQTKDYIYYESALLWLVDTLSSPYERARAILQPNILPGDCWAFKGSKGEAIIQLLGGVWVSGMSLEHIPPAISPTQEISSAPRLFKLEGLVSKNDIEGHIFGMFEYDKNGPPIQQFNVKFGASRYYFYIRIQFLSNWGYPKYTCIYRTRIHGKLAQEF